MNKRKEMKTVALTAIGLTLLACGCSDEGGEARTPQAAVQVSSTALAVNESMELRFTGVADQVVVFTGDAGHVYELRDSSNTGTVVNKGLLTYSYGAQGTYHVVCVASTYDAYLGASLQHDTVGFYVQVTDDVNTIRAISATVTPNIYYAELVGDADWVMRLPTKQLYNNREMTVNAARQRLSFDIASDSASVYIDGEPYVARNYYALNTTHDIRVVSAAGNSRDYRLYGLIYPEFKTITVGGQKPTLARSAYYQDVLTYTAPGMGALEFTLDDDVCLLADGVEVSSGSAFNPEAQYELRRTLTSLGEGSGVGSLLTATTRIEFIITEEE